ncbi:S-layer homology domain-containing protein [Paenibacillus sp. N4]|uniref:S-layer homology domain-containing protein n=1 Tax=Paenibacillus vietnamensis TaxID=2590547 RepID=UPI001CD06BB8|nr:S-layer homology domain-containing protein [Paenibacillus vietnamensis]MCA0754352.1 S-layer homology domain-containing protein [Paenibacillus vietnamensis]
MPLQKTGKKIIIGALAFSLVAGSGTAVIPASVLAAAAQTTPFTDIVAGHWAEKHVAKLSLQGIITGYQVSGGTFEFRPNKNVSQEEAVLMALRFAGLEDEIDEDTLIGFPDSFSVGAFFKPYILLAFSSGLLDQQEEFDLAAENPDAAWGSKPASREWVTKLMIRAIGQGELAEQLEGVDSSFTDADEVDGRYKGYVNAAASLELVKGVTADKFAPKSDVTRASLATLISRAQAKFPVEYEGQSSGIVSQLTDSRITLYKDGSESSYTLDDSTLYYENTSETPISKERLPLYGDVTVIAKDGNAKYIEVTGVTAHTELISGTLDRVIASESKLYAWVDNKPVEFRYDSALTVTDNTGAAVALSELKRDTPITIMRDTFREQPLALKIVATPQAASAFAVGEYYGSDGELITVKSEEGLVTKFLADGVAVEIEGMTGTTVADLMKESDKVELSLNADDQVTKIKVVNRTVKQLTGAKISTYDADNKLLTVIDENNGASALYVNDRTKFDFGGNAMTLEAAKTLLTKNRKVIVSYTGSTIVSLQFVSKYEGTLVSLNSITNTLTLRLDSGATVSVPYNTAIVEIAGGALASYSSLKSGDRLTLLLNADQDKVATIKAHRSLQYEIVSVDSAGKKLTVKNGAATDVVVPLFNVDVYNEAGSKIAISGLQPGMLISAAYEGSLPESVRIVTATYGTVQAVTAGSVTITNQAGQSVVLSGEKGFVIYKGAVQDSVTNLLTAGDYVEVLKTEDGKTQITAAQGETRTFASYNLLTGLVVTEKTSASDTRNAFKVTALTKYYQGGSAVTASSFKSGDRITVYAFRNTAIAIVKA